MPTWNEVGPELLEALRLLVWACTTGDRNTKGKPVGVRVPGIADVDAARAAIARAEEIRDAD